VFLKQRILPPVLFVCFLSKRSLLTTSCLLRHNLCKGFADDAIFFFFFCLTNFYLVFVDRSQESFAVTEYESHGTHLFCWFGLCCRPCSFNRDGWTKLVVSWRVSRSGQSIFFSLSRVVDAGGRKASQQLSSSKIQHNCYQRGES
jgi:hypothetical protein